MTMVAFDTLKLAKRLEAGGFTTQQAAAAAEALAESLAAGASELATKADIAELSRATKADIADVRREIAALEERLIARTTALNAETKADILKWMFGAMAAQTGLIVALLKLLP